ncbi:unnamed protein product [Urochloa humidicola]
MNMPQVNLLTAVRVLLDHCVVKDEWRMPLLDLPRRIQILVRKKTELDAYLDDPRVVVRSDESFNVIAWWKKNSDAYPILSLMARDFLAIPVSTVSSQSAFSVAGRILGKDRTSLSPETLEALICAKDWLIGFSDKEEGEPMTGQRVFGDDEEEGEI